MTRCIIFILFSFLFVQTNAQMLVTRKEAEKSKKVVLICSSYSINDKDNISNSQHYNEEVEVILSRTNNDKLDIQINKTNMKYELINKSYQKSQKEGSMQKGLILFNPTDSATQPEFIYICEPNNQGHLSCLFNIDTHSSNTYEFVISKCIFFDKDGISYNFYTDRTYSLDDDMIYYFINSLKFKTNKKKTNFISRFFHKDKDDIYDNDDD